MLLQNKPIKTSEKIISVKGKVFYNDRRRRIDIKKPVRDLFENDAFEIGYRMEICLSEAKLLQRVKDLAKENVLPVILYFTKGVEND